MIIDHETIFFYDVRLVKRKAVAISYYFFYFIITH